MGLSAHYITSGDIRVAHELAEQLLGLATQIGNPHVEMIASGVSAPRCIISGNSSQRTNISSAG